MTSSQSPDLKREELYRSRDHEHSTCSALEWNRSGTLLYTISETGDYFRGQPIRANQFMVRVEWDNRFATDEAGEKLTEQVLDALSSAKPAERDSSRDELEPLRAQLALAVGVLRPFAAMAPRYQHQTMHVLGWTNFRGEVVYVRPEDFKAAAQALAALSPQQEGEKASPHD